MMSRRRVKDQKARIAKRKSDSEKKDNVEIAEKVTKPKPKPDGKK